VYTGDMRFLKNAFGIKFDQQSILQNYVEFVKACA
jgi:hypothetical protein